MGAQNLEERAAISSSGLMKIQVVKKLKFGLME